MLSRIFRLPRSSLGVFASKRSVSTAGFGDHLFKGAVAEPYLKKHGLAPNTLESPTWTQRSSTADQVYCLYLNAAACSY